ncbi:MULTISPECIES: hypothetical protein [unclassified Streptomyces]|uniref:hypothetical protein n=1 Tax=unclassified Streptomyces TaxID=2593676 RepID=UPI000C277664|nr:hypothetical protein [Streptomyces sp. CB02959]PJN36011.1 hypothetical protein CG747_34870 [Streptomyces sp. CB02959]
MSHETPQAGDLLVRIGAIVFLVGALGTLVTVLPLFLGTHPLPWEFYWVSMLMGAGFLIAGAGVVRSVGAQRRQAEAALAPSPSAPPAG